MLNFLLEVEGVHYDTPPRVHCSLFKVKGVDTMSSSKNGRGRTRNFAFIMYPESCPSNWHDILTDTHVPIFVSPLHDGDTNPTGETKKAHYHVIVMFDGVKTEEQCQEIVDSVNGTMFQKVSTLRGYARYLCHLDNPEKHIYDIDDVTCLSGADYKDAISLVSDKYDAIGEMIDFCNEKGIVSYFALLTYARSNRHDWFRCLCDNGTMVMKEFLKSKEWSERMRKDVDICD